MSGKTALRQLWDQLVKAAVITQVRFPLAAQTWLESRRVYIAAKTFHEYELNIKTLNLFFAEMSLREITPDMIRAYQRMRLQKCGPFAINHECSVLQQMLKRVGRWPELANDYQPLPLPKEKRGRALRDEERERLLRVASSNPNWEAAYLFAVISVNTSAGPKETATLRLKDVNIADPKQGMITVQPGGAKNVHRIRRIPLNDESLAGVTKAVARAARLGSVLPDHYLFPFRVKRSHYDPTRHQTTFKTAWHKLIVAAELPGFRMYDLRHHAITVLLEQADVSDETAEAVAGHISREMKKQYSHIRIEARRIAVDALRPKPVKASVPRKPPKSTGGANTAELVQQLLDMAGKLLKQK